MHLIILVRSQDHNMFVMQSLESLLGHIDTWPTTILKLLFIDDLTPTNIKKVAAFFCRNGIPYHITSYFYNLCNEKGGIHVTDLVQTFRFIWQSARYTPHLDKYYNTQFKIIVWINGRCLAQLEPVLPIVTRILLGMEATGYSLLIRIKLCLIRETVMIFPS